MKIDAEYTIYSHIQHTNAHDANGMNIHTISFTLYSNMSYRRLKTVVFERFLSISSFQTNHTQNIRGPFGSSIFNDYCNAINSSRYNNVSRMVSAAILKALLRNFIKWWKIPSKIQSLHISIDRFEQENDLNYSIHFIISRDRHQKTAKKLIGFDSGFNLYHALSNSNIK